MRDIKRIDKFCDRLKEVWKQVPDMRFLQLIWNIPFEGDAFFIEEDEAIEAIEEYINSIAPKKKISKIPPDDTDRIAELERKFDLILDNMEKLYDNQAKLMDEVFPTTSKAKETVISADEILKSINKSFFEDLYID